MIQIDPRETKGNSYFKSYIITTYETLETLLGASFGNNQEFAIQLSDGTKGDIYPNTELSFTKDEDVRFHIAGDSRQDTENILHELTKSIE